MCSSKLSARVVLSAILYFAVLLLLIGSLLYNASAEDRAREACGTKAYLAHTESDDRCVPFGDIP